MDVVMGSNHSQGKDETNQGTIITKTLYIRNNTVNVFARLEESISLAVSVESGWFPASSGRCLASHIFLYSL